MSSSAFTKLVADIKVLGTEIYNDIQSTGVGDAINAVVKADLQAAVPQIMSDLQSGGELFSQGVMAGLKSYADSLSANMTSAQKQAVESAFEKCEQEAGTIASKIWTTDMKTTIDSIADSLTAALQGQGTSFDATWLSSEIYLKLESGISIAAVDVIANRDFVDVQQDALDAAISTGALVSPSSSQMSKFYSNLNGYAYDGMNNVTTVLENEINPQIQKVDDDVNNVLAQYTSKIIQAIESNFTLSNVTTITKDVVSVVKSTASKAKSFFKKLFH